MVFKHLIVDKAQCAIALSRKLKNVLKTGTLFACLFACAHTYAQGKVGLTYNVGVDVTANYIWRGMYAGGLGVQSDVSVGYGGLYVDMWWNIGAKDWTFQTTPANARVKGFNPEVDMSIGFSRWGLDVKFMHMYYFDTYSDGTPSHYFDFKDPEDGVGGITTEWRIKYRVSDKLPLSILLCTRTWGRDGYFVEHEDGTQTRKRAYSSYIELGYDFRLPWEMTLATRVGMTPWKSLYTKYQADFAVVDVDVKLMRSWDIADKCRMNVFAELMLNPYDLSRMAADKEDYIPINGGRQCLWNVGCGFYLK
ncbi:MAG: hypothetical protein MJZ55_00520 [Paludibacteraceae bacterium]|nr:hypothetical protein [Paludibacteraceae bacterium]